MKITIFGLTISSSWGNGHATPWRAILSSLHRARHQVTFYEKDLDFYALRRDLPRPSFCRLVLYRDWESVRGAALVEAAASDAVIVTSYCPQGARVNDDVLALATPLRAYYDMDTAVTLGGLSAKLDYLRRDQIPAFDLYLSFVGGPVLQVLEREYGARLARPLYGCVDPDVYRRVAPVPELACDFSYMGTYASGRQEKLDGYFLEPARRLPARRFVLAGALYPRHWTWPSNLVRFDHLAPQDHSAFYSSSRLTLNITREEMARWGYCPSGRFFEAAACGTPIVTDAWDGLETFFQPGEEVFVVRDSEDVMAALATGDAGLQALAARARRRTLEEASGSIRAVQLISYLEEAASAQRARPLEVAS